jgi:hypothetical protein
MGNGDIVAGKATSNQLTPKEQIKNADGPRPAAPRQQQMCGAMAQQGDEYHTLSQPQEFVRLVGYRDPRIRPPRAPN